MLKVAWAPFAVVCCWGLLDVHECTGRLQMAAYPLGKQTAGCNSPHDWLMSLAMDSTALCDMWRWKWHKWMPFGWFWWRRSLCMPATSWLPTHPSPSHPVGVLLVLATPVKNYLKWREIQLAIHPVVGGYSTYKEG